MYKIITHPGSAHKDDFMSVSILLATLGSADIFRREATSEDLADPNTYVVDVGMDYDLEKHNFDHHQDSTFPCAFHLVMRYLGYHDTAMVVFGWYAHMSMMDVRGPYKTAEHLGVDTSVLFASSSPIDLDSFCLARLIRSMISVKDPSGNPVPSPDSSSAIGCAAAASASSSSVTSSPRSFFTAFIDRLARAWACS